MSADNTTPGVALFGPYAFDLRSGELSKHGKRIKLGQQPSQILLVFLERPGDLVTREELRVKLWSNDTFVDFAHGLNSAVQRLRDCLSDSAGKPRWIETVPRRGYRFIGEVQWLERGGGNGTTSETTKAEPAAPHDHELARLLGQKTSGLAETVSAKRYWRAPLLASLALLLAVCGGFGVLLHRRTSQHEPELHRLSFGRGIIRSARFAGDGTGVIYGAAWDGEPFQLFWVRHDGRESSLLSPQSLDILSVSSRGQMAVLLDRRFSVGLMSSGTLALMPVTGTEPRPLLPDVQEADWDPSGDELAITHYVGDRCQLQFPLGTVFYQTVAGSWISHVRVSPTGKSIAFLEHPLQGDTAGYVVVVDLAGKKRRLSADFVDVQGLAWDPSGQTVWFSGNEIGPGVGRAVYKVAMNGKQTLLRRESTDLTLQDISRDGHILISRDTFRQEVFGRIHPEQQERNLGWQDNSYASYLSADGSTIVLSVQGEAAGAGGYAVYIRRTSPNATAFRLGEGSAGPLSADGKWVLALHPGGAKASVPPHLILLPTAVGKPRELTNAVRPSWRTAWLPDGRILFVGNEPGDGPRNWIMNPDGTQVHPITPEGIIGERVSPHGEVLVADAEGKFWLYSIHGGDRLPVRGISTREFPIGWSEDEKMIFTARQGRDTTDVYSVNVLSGRTALLFRLAPSDRAGVTNTPSVLVTPDGRSYVYSYFRILSDLYSIAGLN